MKLVTFVAGGQTRLGTVRGDTIVDLNLARAMFIASRGGEARFLAADALDWCGASRADPLPLEGLRERFLPECTFRGRQNKKLPVRSAGRSSPPWRDRPGPA